MVLSTNIIPPEAESSERSRRDLQSRLSGLGKLDDKNMSEAQKEKKLREACEGFESIFIQKMWQEMRNTLPKSNLLQGREEQFWQGMYDQELAKKMTSAGGIGLANMMYAQLSQNLVSASRASASAPAAGQRVFAPEAAPMLPATTAVAAAQDVPVGTVGREDGAGQRGQALPQIYDGAAPLRDAGRVEEAPTPEPFQGGVAAPNPPEVDQALAVLRAQQAAQDVDPAQSRRHKTTLTSTMAPNMNSGLNLARMAQFEAGSKLGANAVRPPLRQMAGLGNSASAQDGAAQAVGQPANMGRPQPLAQPEAAFVQGIAPLTAEGVTPAQPVGAPLPVQTGVQAPQPGAWAAQQAVERPGQPVAPPPVPQPQKVRYTTNIPPKGGNRKQNVIRMLNVDAVGPNSKAGAGLAAYHAQQAAAAPLPDGTQAEARVSPQAVPPTGQGGVQPAAVSAPGGQISVYPAGQAPGRNSAVQAEAAPAVIPPLTAADTQASSPGPY